MTQDVILRLELLKPFELIEVSLLELLLVPLCLAVNAVVESVLRGDQRVDQVDLAVHDTPLLHSVAAAW